MTRKYVQSLPDLVRISGYDIPIKKAEEIKDGDKQSWGTFENEAITIVLEHPSKMHAAMVFVHEVNHAIWSFGGHQKEATEEAAVSCISSGTMQVARDNPWFLSWLKKAL